MAADPSFRPPSKSPIWARLNLRLGVLMGAVLVVLLAFQPRLEDWLSTWVGTPPEELAIGLEEAVDTALCVLDGIEYVAPDPADGEDAAPAWLMTDEEIAELGPIVEEFGRGYLWVLPDGIVQAASDSFVSFVGKEWEYPVDGEEAYSLIDDEGRAATAMPVEMADEEEYIAGYLIAVEFGEGAAFDGEGRLFLDEYEIDLYMFPLHDHLVGHRLNEAGLRLRRWVALGFSAAAALILSLVLTRFVTRRLFRMINEADRPVEPGMELPGPFPDQGSDEVARLGRALNQMRDRTTDLVEQLKRQDEERRRWIAQVSHDIRTPLAALTACLERAQRLADRGELQESGDQLLSAATHDAARVKSLAEDLVEVARLEAGVPLRREVLMPEELVGAIARGFEALIRERGLNLIQDIQSPLPDLYADGRLLSRAVENLIRNALRHADTTMHVRALQQQDQLLIEVGDDGKGFKIDVGLLEDRRLEELRKAADSTGLGLQLSRQVVEAHGGRIELAQSTLGGAAVQVWLPLPE